MARTQTKSSKTSLGTSRKSMLHKSWEKKRVGRIHNTNFTAGSILADSYHLYRTGLRGRKRWIFFAVLATLFIVAAGNLALTSLVLWVLQFTPNGLPYLVFGPNNTLMFTQPVNISTLLVSHTVSSFQNHSLNLTARKLMIFHAGPVRNVMATEDMLQNSSQFIMEGSNVVFKPYHTFEIVDKGTSGVVLSANESVVSLPDGLAFANLTTPSLAVQQVLSMGNLTVSSQKLQLSADKGVTLEGDSATMDSKKAVRIAFRNKNEEQILVASETVVLSELPLSTANAHTTSLETGYQLCLCENGRLFRVLKDCAEASALNSLCAGN